MSVCLKCGLPKELCTCSQLLMAEQLITVDTDKRRFNKPVTLIRGLNIENMGSDALKDLLSELKKKLACGGTYDKDNKWIELQGDHKAEVKKILTARGFKFEGENERENAANREKIEGGKVKQ